jgi:CDGSH-type Zn-finger protein
MSPAHTAKVAAKRVPSAPSAPAPAMKVVVTKNGPYVVSGKVPLALQVIQPNEGGFSWNWVETRTFDVPESYALCRCGHSNNKPFCDGSHARVGFDGSETATRQPYDRQSETLEGPTLVLQDAEELCAFARFCDPGGKIWSLIERTNEPAARKLALREGMSCPGGRLVLHDKRTGQAIEPDLPPSIGVVEDPALGCSGPLWVRGGIRVESEDGKPYEIRNRMAVCRCGASANKPFCNGSHASIKFNDGMV